MARTTGTYATTTTLGEPVKAFIPHPLPPSEPGLAESAWADRNRAAQMALARLAAVAGLVPSVDWLLYSAIRKEALMTSQIEGTQATLTDLFDEEAGLAVSNTDDVEEVTNYLQAFRLVQDNLRDAAGLPISVRLLCDAHRLLLNGVRGTGKQPGELRRSQNWIGGTRPGNAVFVPPPADRVPVLLADLEDVTNTRVLLAWGERLSWGRGYVVHILPLEQVLEAPLADDMSELTAQINLAMERVIGLCPQQYLWGYARYKSPRSAA